MVNNICELINVSKKYGNYSVLRHINMSIAQGEMIAITGKSGAGKTTILNTIGMLEQPDEGSIKLFGNDLPHPRSSHAVKLLRNHISYLFQNYALIDNATIDANLDVALAYSKKSKSEKKLLKINALSQVGLNLSLKQKVHELSGGEQQRVAIARVILKPCELILADEPTGSLDGHNRDDILALLQQLNSEGKTLIIVTHDSAVAQACSRIINI
ncbi:ABC transporter ATP-binding protein [Paenibacillus brasilensis]|nr:ABC transporter ATP-binding protein [Paenibacillus brasilensis]